MNTATFYPVFEADQVLTNAHLNNMFNYIEQQDRLTRMKLVGSGIVCGLDVSFREDDSIAVSKGCGLTSQGYLIAFCDTVFTHFIPYSTTEFPADLHLLTQCDTKTTNAIPFYKDAFGNGSFELLTKNDFDKLNADEKQTAVAFSNNSPVDLKKYTVVLFFDADEESLKNCDTNDCNDKGSQMNFEVKALLVEKTVIDKINQTQQTTAPVGNPGVTPQLHHVELKRYNVPVQDLKSADDVLQAFVALVDDAKLKSIAEVLNYCFVHYYYLLENEPANPFENVWQQFKKLRDEIIKNNPVLIQYFYDFIDDVLKAYYEFKYKVFEVSSSCCGDEMAFPLHLVLGEALQTVGSQASDSYRQRFIYSPLFNNQKSGLAEVRLLFTRIKLLISQADFTSLTDFQTRLVKVTPSRYGHTFLSDRCIPYHYKVTDTGKELYPYWNYEKTSRSNERFNLGYNAFQYCAADNVVNPLLYDIERFDFFRIEGHIGKSILPAMSLVKTIQQQNNLPFDIAAVSADYIGALVKGEEPQCVIQYLESDYRVLIATFICKLHDAFCFVARLPYVLPVQILKFTAATLPKATPEEAASIKEALAFNPDVLQKADHPFTTSLVNEFQAVKTYTKGNTLLKLCNPPANTIGNAYIQMQGRFVNPVAINTSQPASLAQFHAFEFVDAVESMLELVMNFELSDIDINELKSRTDRFEKEVRTLSVFTISFLQTLENNDKAQLSTLASELYLDLLVFNLEMLLQLCFTEQVEALKTEYRRRMAQYRLATNFSYYFRHHGGVEHKAGVPRGGTFIFVYHEKIRERLVDKNSLFINKELSNLMLSNFRDILGSDVSSDTLLDKTKLLQTVLVYKDPALYTRFHDVLTKYLDDCKDLPDVTRNELTGIINTKPQQPHFKLTDGMVIADFFIPYICCSDCPPVAYILPQPSVPDTLRVSQSDPVCDEQGKNFTVTLTVTGGTPPYSYTANNVTTSNNQITLASNSSDTIVSIKDNSNQTITTTIKSHQCAQPCNLPCNGLSENCKYALWLPKPHDVLKDAIKHTTRIAKLTLTDENGNDTTIDLTKTFIKIFDGIIKEKTFDDKYVKIFEEINILVKNQAPDFLGNDQPMFTYDAQLQNNFQNLAVNIEKFACHHVKLEIEASVIFITHEQTNYIVFATYNDTGVFIRIESQEQNFEFNVPKFDCLAIDKCTGTPPVKSCKEQLNIKEINAKPDPAGNLNLTFTTTPGAPIFDTYFWYFHFGNPMFSTNEAPVVTSETRSQIFVRVMGIHSATGCYAILEQMVNIG